MANLAQTQTPIGSRRRASTTRDFTLPARRQTDGPGLEVNAPIVGRNKSGAQALMEILNVANDAAGSGLEALQIAEDRKRDEQRALGSADAVSGREADPALLKVRAYANGFHKAAAQRSAVELGIKGEQAVQELLAKDPDATLEDVNEALDQVFSSVAVDEDGNPRLLGTAEATRDFATILAGTRAQLLGPAAEQIRTRQWDKDLDNRAFLLIAQGLPGVGPLPGSGKIAGPLEAAPQGEPKGTLIAPKVVPTALITGRMPVAGRVTDDFTKHLKRKSAGLDIAAPPGSPVELPASGVVRVGRDARSGNYVQVDHGNGVVSTYSHLSRVDVKSGQRVEAGTVLGGVGQTGNATGPHLHYRVKVNGKDVDPASYKFDGAPGAQDGRSPSDPNLAPADDGTRLGTIAPPKVDFESVINDPALATIPIAYRKEKMLQAIMIYADEYNRPDVLEGLWRSTRPDGTPSFSPKEIATIRDEAERLSEKGRIEAKRAERDRHEANEEKLLSEYINDREPSKAMLQDWANKGLISPEFAFSQIRHSEAEAEQAAREARAEERMARAEAEQETDSVIASMIVAREAGILTDAGYEDDRARFMRGEFGFGKRAAARFRTLQAASRRGLAVVQEQPLAKMYAADLAQIFPRTTAARGGGLLDRLGSNGDTRLHDAALAAYSRYLSEGLSPPEAHAKVFKEYRAVQQGGRSARQSRIKELQSK